MYHLDNESGVGTMPPISGVGSATPQWFTESPPSYPGADWYNVVQAELLNIISSAGLTPEKFKLNQLSLAIKKIAGDGIKLSSAIDSVSETVAATSLAVKKTYDLAAEKLSKSNNLSDLTDISVALKNLGLPSLITGDVPDNLNTLKKLADAINNNPRYYADVEQLIFMKLSKSANGSDISDKVVFLRNLGLDSYGTQGVRLPGGFILQYVDGMSAANGILTVTLPQAFPNYIVFGLAGELEPNSWTSQGNTTIWGFNYPASSKSVAVAYVRTLTGGPAAAHGGILVIGR